MKRALKPHCVTSIKGPKMKEIFWTSGWDPITGGPTPEKLKSLESIFYLRDSFDELYTASY